ncbi:MAG: GTPase [Lachnospiraceae bacterium]|nr:GTPase [Lachnospiraceae bacterium]MCR4596135.1 GTPase [Lachnospiraceae bacterium]
MITGFLESGKSEFINYTLAQPYFQAKGTTLLILCEEGEIEYDPELLKSTRTVKEVIENEEDFTPEKLQELDKAYKPERVIVEFNGMWNYRNVKLPWFWSIEQQITTIDASTFPMYYNNMKSLLNEMIKKSELIIFNRCDGLGEELATYKRNIKAVNPKADIVFEDAQGEISQIFEADLPFDLNADVIEMDNYGFGIFFIDAMDHLDRYVGKTIRYLAQVMKPDGMPESMFVPGRMAMTCCAEDMSFLGYPCRYDRVRELENKDWITITARVGKAALPEYEGNEGPLLEAVEIVPAKEPSPRDQVISFS